MKIIESERKPGIYAQWFEVYGYNEKNEECWFMIYRESAKTIEDAIKYWQKKWGKKNCKALYIKNAEPYDIKYAQFA